MSVETEFVEITALRDGFSPRLDGIIPLHVRQLADIVDQLPPILVQRSTMRVVDGMHRLHVARSRNVRFVQVAYFDGSDEEAFLAAVRLNATHGMPLSASDRAAAAERILLSHPDWSDRRIASTCGVAPKTVAGLRLRSTDDGARLNTRIGRDGRRHPVSSDEGRHLAAEVMREDVTASLRSVARRCGISLGTAADVRRRLIEAADDDGSARPAEKVTVLSSAPRLLPEPEGRQLLERLTHDPSLRYNERGRALLRLLGATLAFADQSALVADHVPGHCRDSLHTIAQLCAAGWEAFGQRIEGGSPVPARPAA